MSTFALPIALSYILPPKTQQDNLFSLAHNLKIKFAQKFAFTKKKCVLHGYRTQFQFLFPFKMTPCLISDIFWKVLENQ